MYINYLWRTLKIKIPYAVRPYICRRYASLVNRVTTHNTTDIKDNADKAITYFYNIVSRRKSSVDRKRLNKAFC